MSLRLNKRIRGRRGVGAIEFVLVVIPTIFLTTSIFEMALESWKFHSMAYAIAVADRYACSHGRTCAKGGNSCTIRVEDVANVIAGQAPALDSSQLNITLTTGATTVNCHPLSQCFTTTDQFPNSADNGVGSNIRIDATYPMGNPILMLWFGSAGSSGNSYTLGATTTQSIFY